MLHDPPESLPDGFERVDDQQAKEQNAVKTSGASGTSVTSGRGTGPNASALGVRQVDGSSGRDGVETKAILDMLKRDVRT